jgi:hypothetical protein
MANLYRVDYTACVKVGTAGPSQLRTQTENSAVFVSATSEANAIAAVKTAEKRNANANLDYCNFVVTQMQANILVGS